MKVKTCLLLIITSCVLGSAICFPAVLLKQQERRLLLKVHAEKLDEPSSVQKPGMSMEEKLSMISAAGLADSSMVMLEMSGREEISVEENIVEMAQKSLSELSQQGMIPQIDITGYAIGEFSHVVYSNPDARTSIDCYSFLANGGGYDFYTMIDADTGQIYSLSIMSSQQEKEAYGYEIVLSKNAVQAWEDHLGIKLIPAEELSEYGSRMYRVKDSDACYMFSSTKDVVDIQIQLINARAFAYSDANMMKNSGDYDAADN